MGLPMIVGIYSYTHDSRFFGASRRTGGSGSVQHEATVDLKITGMKILLLSCNAWWTIKHHPLDFDLSAQKAKVV